MSLTADQVINKLRVEIELLWNWAVNEGDGTSPTFYEKMKLLNDKIAEREKFEQLREENI